MTANATVTALTASKPFRRNNIIVFWQNNHKADRLQALVRDILERNYPDVAAEVYDAHVYRSMSRNGMVNMESAEEVDRRLNNFRTAARGVLFNSKSVKEGFNCVDVDCVIIGCPSKSPQQIIQMIGRCMRFDPANPDKYMECLMDPDVRTIFRAFKLGSGVTQNVSGYGDCGAVDDLSGQQMNGIMVGNSDCTAEHADAAALLGTEQDEGLVKLASAAKPVDGSHLLETPAGAPANWFSL
ncbi:hypothetical protein OEZ85_000314 [Tetradesmus obliquus]|uniref:Helicase C-terminal domain-containing protein n=1 Tax=Tetradesmus obliquus TaxID=3088 RepID=A0ABY8UPW0_TETOB|nr:hypothetical protein OEZ85_000314 [Tetradesmus obliquus]